MTAYLVANPPRVSQFRRPRRGTPTGTQVLHSAENTPDLRPPDDGAENVARFIQGRSDHGSYHLLGDMDSDLLLVPFEWEAFHDGTGSNPWSIGISIALRASDWPHLTNEQRLWYCARMATMARKASNWLVANGHPATPARWLTKATHDQPGFCTHMEREQWFGTPGRRSDPWGNDAGMRDLFLELYADTEKEADDMAYTQKDAAKKITEIMEIIRGSADPAGVKAHTANWVRDEHYDIVSLAEFMAAQQRTDKARMMQAITSLSNSVKAMADQLAAVQAGTADLDAVQRHVAQALAKAAEALEENS